MINLLDPISASLQILGMIAEGGTTIIALIMVFFILKKNAKYLGNRLMAIAAGLIGAYTFFILLYDLIQKNWAIQIFLRLAIISILNATLFIFFAMQVMVNSSHWFEVKSRWIPFILVIVGYSLFLIIDQTWITVVSETPVNTQISLIQLGIAVVIILTFLIMSLILLYIFGLKKVDRTHRIRMQLFAVGILVSIIAIGTNIASQVVTNELVARILDVTFFSILAIAIFVQSLAFIRKE